jgi:hypothetical protein
MKRSSGGTTRLPAAREGGGARRILAPVAAALAGAALAGFAAIAVNGCSNKDAVLGVAAGVNPPASGVSLSRDVQPILTQRCALSGCHAAPLSGPMSLAAGATYTALVSVASCESSTYLRVFPLSSDLSYLIIKLRGQQHQVGSCQPCALPSGTVSDCGNQMPDAINPLSVGEIQLISDWINQGALDN